MSAKRNSSRPAPGSRSWIHPSELGRVDAAWGPSVRRVRPVLSLSLVAVLAGGALLFVNRSPAPHAEPVTAHRATNLDALPVTWRTAASDAVVLSGARGHHPGFVVTPSLVVSYRRAGDVVSVRGLGEVRSSAVYLGRDPATGLRVWRIAHELPVAEVVPLPFDTTVTALVAQWHHGHVNEVWGVTAMGDPDPTVRGPLRVLTDTSQRGLHAPDGTVSLTSQGRVSAILAQGRWWPMGTVAQIARVVATNGSCRVRWLDGGRDAPGGGVLVTRSGNDAVRVGDVITRFNGRVVESWAQLRSRLYLTTRGSLATWVSDRAGQIRADRTRLSCSP